MLGCGGKKRMAPQVGLEPTTLRLTAGCSAIELLRSVVRPSAGGSPSAIGIHHSIFRLIDKVTGGHEKTPAAAQEARRDK
jgi:hypothetical protein